MSRKNSVDPRIHIGEEYGLYKIVGVVPEKSNDGHVLFKGVCKECGYEKHNSLSQFKSKNVQECRHKNLLTEEQLNSWYEKNKKQCLFCGKDLPLGDLSFIDYKKRKFCNNSCSASYYNVSRGKETNLYTKYNKGTYVKNRKFCLNCGKELALPLQKKYCSILCQKDFQYKEYIEKWKNGEVTGTIKEGASDYVKRYIREKYNNQCCKCGWHEINPTTGKVPVEVHHVDGDYTHNEEDNLELLCPNCHSLTSTYKALNCGEGRKDRYK